jgi:ribonuclease PH
MDAGIPMTEYVVACTASLANGDVPLVDISHLEENSGGPNLTIAALPLSGKVRESGAFSCCERWALCLPFTWKHLTPKRTVKKIYI